MTRHRPVATLLVILVLASLFVPYVGAVKEVDSDPQETVEVIVGVEDYPFFSTLKATSKVEQLKAQARESQKSIKTYAEKTEGITFKKGFWITNAVLLEIDPSAVDMDTIRSLDSVETVEKNTKVRVNTTAESTATGTGTWGVESIGAPEVWDEYNTMGEGVNVSVLDTGVDGSHPDIDVAKWKDYSNSPSATPVDYSDHGTHTSGTVVGGNASGEYIGVAPEATLFHAAVIYSCNTNDGCAALQSDVLSGMEWSIEQGADVISMSLGFGGYSTSFLDAVENANNAGVVVVASIGNDGVNQTSAPGNIHDVISVGAYNSSESIASFSGGEWINTNYSYGVPDWPETYHTPKVVAPGVDITSAAPGGGYQSLQGTSMAAPHVAGTVALMLSVDDEIDNRDVMEILMDTADGEYEEIRGGAGRIDALSAVATADERSTIQGTVTNSVGEPIEGATVDIGSQSTTTDGNGEYELSVSSYAEYTLNVDNDTYESASTTVTTGKNDTVTADFKLSPVFDAEVASQDDIVLNGTAGEVDFDLNYAANATIELHPDTTVDKENITVTLGDQEITLGETMTFQNLVTNASYPLQVDFHDGVTGDVKFTYEFSRETRSTTGTTEVISALDPVAELQGAKVTSAEHGPFTSNRTLDFESRQTGMTVEFIPNGTVTNPELVVDGEVFATYNGTISESTTVEAKPAELSPGRHQFEVRNGPVEWVYSGYDVNEVYVESITLNGNKHAIEQAIATNERVPLYQRAGLGQRIETELEINESRSEIRVVDLVFHPDVNYGKMAVQQGSSHHSLYNTSTWTVNEVAPNETYTTYLMYEGQSVTDIDGEPEHNETDDSGLIVTPDSEETPVVYVGVPVVLGLGLIARWQNWI